MATESFRNTQWEESQACYFRSAAIKTDKKALQQILNNETD